jgi:hypothetical protein
MTRFSLLQQRAGFAVSKIKGQVPGGLATSLFALAGGQWLLRRKGDLAG